MAQTFSHSELPRLYESLPTAWHCLLSDLAGPVLVWKLHNNLQAVRHTAVQVSMSHRLLKSTQLDNS